MIYVVIYRERGRWQYAAHSSNRDEALGALTRERLLHPEREYKMQSCGDSAFEALFAPVDKFAR